MEITANLRNLRIAPRKVRLVANLISGKKVVVAEQQLAFTQKLSSAPLLKLLNSAVANAKHNYKLDKADLKIKQILVQEGYTLKRWLPRAHGRATVLRKRGSQVLLTLVSMAKPKLIDKPKKIPAKK